MIWLRTYPGQQLYSHMLLPAPVGFRHLSFMRSGHSAQMPLVTEDHLSGQGWQPPYASLW